MSKQPTMEHKRHVCSLYKRILSEAQLFFDDRTRTFLVQRAKSRFRDNMHCHDAARIKLNLKEATKGLHRIERANRGNLKSALKLLQSAYGRRGKTRHCLLRPYLVGQAQEPLVPGKPRTALPPPLVAPLVAIIDYEGRKPFHKVQLPESPFKPLSQHRIANLAWRWRSNLLSRIQLPLPIEILRELETRAGAPSDHPLRVKDHGGPRWHEFYSVHRDNVALSHLSPDIKLIPRTKLHRQQPLLPSPYAHPPSPYATATMLHMLQPPPERVVSPPVPYRPRALRRLYKRLLMDVPLLTPSPTLPDLTNHKMQYHVSQSHWAPGNVTLILQDHQVPEIH